MAAETGSAYNYSVERDRNATPTTNLHSEMVVSNLSNEISTFKKKRKQQEQIGKRGHSIIEGQISYFKMAAENSGQNRKQL
jgi:hypothetical protein